MAWGARRGSHKLAAAYYPIARHGQAWLRYWMLQEGLTMGTDRFRLDTSGTIEYEVKPMAQTYECPQHSTGQMTASEAQMHYLVIQHHTAAEYVSEDQIDEDGE
jgi:hypothetical protein